MAHCVAGSCAKETGQRTKDMIALKQDGVLLTQCVTAGTEGSIEDKRYGNRIRGL